MNLHKEIIFKDGPPNLKTWLASRLLDIAELGANLVTNGIEAPGNIRSVQVVKDGKDLEKE